MAAGTSVRRRLSRIIHRASSSSGIRPPRLVGPGHAGQQPAGDLPVASRPSAPAAGVGQVAFRMIFQQFHVAEESAPGMAALDQVMAENPVVGEPGTHGGVECLDVVDGLADELALSEQVLVNVGDLAGVGVQANVSREQAGEA